MATWKDSALLTMNTIRAAGIAEGKTKEEIANLIDKSYPFGERKHYPYKAWLSARKEFFSKHGLPNKSKKDKKTFNFFEE